jgi:hypothetical protein
MKIVFAAGVSLLAWTQLQAAGEGPIHGWYDEPSAGGRVSEDP